MTAATPRSTLAVVDAWVAAVRVETGQGWQLFQLERFAPRLVRSLGAVSFHFELVEFGFACAQGGHSLGFTLRSLDLLATVVEPSTAALLDRREVAVLAAEGWNAAEMARLHAADDVMPIAMFVHLLRQRCVAGRSVAQPPVTPADAAHDRGVAMVIVDLQAIELGGIDLASASESFVASMRSLFGPSAAITRGSNGNLAVMAERGAALYSTVQRLRDAISAADVAGAERVHVWIEPVGTSVVNVQSHLESIVGPVDPGRRDADRACELVSR